MEYNRYYEGQSDQSRAWRRFYVIGQRTCGAVGTWHYGGGIGDFEGGPVGQLTDTDGVKHNVFITMEEIDVSGLTEGEQNRLFAMQKEINFIIENLE